MIYHLHWRGQRNGIQTGWYILDATGEEWGRIEWRDGQVLVVYTDGRLFRNCGISHGASFAAASALVEQCTAAEATSASLTDVSH